MHNIINYKKRTIKKGGVNMCPPIKKIQGKTPNEILTTFYHSNNIPIDLTEILSNIGISAIPDDFTKLEKKSNKKDILGLVLKDDKNAVIYYKKDDSLSSQRFTIAHELGHICTNIIPECDYYPYIDIDWRIKGECTDPKEIEANIFAGELLIPLNKLKEIYLSLSFPSSKVLALIFVTPIDVMEERLNYLKISYYDKKGQAVIYGNQFT